MFVGQENLWGRRIGGISNRGTREWYYQFNPETPESVNDPSSQKQFDTNIILEVKHSVCRLDTDAPVANRA